MGSVVDDEVGEIELGEEREREFDVEETIFVAVSKKVEESKTMLFWAIENFAGKRICVLHVHQPQFVAELSESSLNAGLGSCLVAGNFFFFSFLFFRKMETWELNFGV